MFVKINGDYFRTQTLDCTHDLKIFIRENYNSIFYKRIETPLCFIFNIFFCW